MFNKATQQSYSQTTLRIRYVSPSFFLFGVACLQELNKALEEVSLTPDKNSNALNTDVLASVTLTVNDLGHSGEGGAQESEPVTISVIFSAVNDGPTLELPDYLAAREDVSLLVSGIRATDTDSDEPGGETYLIASGKEETDANPLVLV